jgi:hypothetical protein
MSFDPELKKILLLSKLADDELKVLDMVMRQERYAAGKPVC